MDRKNMLTRIKKTVQAWITSEAKVLDRFGFTPNMITGIGVILGLASGITYWLAGISLAEPIYRYYLVSAILILLASGFCDALDGTMARLCGKASIKGGFLDSLLDRYVEASVYCGLVLGGLCGPFWGLLALVGSLLTSYVRARSEAAGIPMETIGVIERAERLLIIVVGSAFTLAWTEALWWSTVILALGTNLTVLERTLYFLRKVGSDKK